MIKANVILDHSKWKNKIKNPNDYFKKKFNKLSKIPFLKKEKQELSILLTNNKKMKDLNYRFRKNKSISNGFFRYWLYSRMLCRHAWTRWGFSDGSINE